MNLGAEEMTQNYSMAALPEGSVTPAPTVAPVPGDLLPFTGLYGH